MQDCVTKALERRKEFPTSSILRVASIGNVQAPRALSPHKKISGNPHHWKIPERRFVFQADALLVFRQETLNCIKNGLYCDANIGEMACSQIRQCSFCLARVWPPPAIPVSNARQRELSDPVSNGMESTLRLHLTLLTWAR